MNVIEPLSVLFLLSFFFHGRGMWKSRGDDLILGSILFVLSSFIFVAVIPHSGSLGFIGGFWLVFALISIGFSSRIDDSKIKHFTRQHAKEYGLLILLLGLLFSIVA